MEIVYDRILGKLRETTGVSTNIEKNENYENHLSLTAGVFSNINAVFEQISINSNLYEVFTFDHNTTNSIVLDILNDGLFVNGNIKISIFSFVDTNEAVNNKVTWKIEAVCYTDSDSLDLTYGTAEYITQTISTGEVLNKVTSNVIEIGNVEAIENSVVRIKITRDIDVVDPEDTMVLPVRFIGAIISTNLSNKNENLITTNASSYSPIDATHAQIFKGATQYDVFQFSNLSKQSIFLDIINDSIFKTNVFKIGMLFASTANEVDNLANTVSWEISAVAINPIDNLDITYGTPVVVSKANVSDASVYNSVVSTNITIGGILTSTSIIRIKVSRLHETPDGLDQIVSLIGTMLQINQ